MADDFADGWDEDLDDLIDDDDLGDAGNAPTFEPASAGVDGWGDELDDLDVSTSNLVTLPTTMPSTSAGQQESGWNEDEDIFSDTLEEEPKTPPRRQSPNNRVEDVFQELVSYVESMMILLPSINAVLSAEQNNPGKAEELLHYYRERPQLREYTIEKELSRMDYQVNIQHASGEDPTVVDNKQEIAQLFKLQNELDLLARCANQSLLADLLHVMTGPDGLVRPQYMATCLAESCSFVITCSPGVPGGVVECTTRLILSLPEPSGKRYPIANLNGHIMLGVPSSPQSPPLIEFKLESMDIVIPSMEVLRPTAHFLVESGLLDHPSMSPFPETPGGPIDDNDTFRDVFLQQSQNMLQNSTVGLKSAWKQIDTVAGFSSKMTFVQKMLPTADGLEAAMQEQEAYQIHLQAQRGQGAEQQHSAFRNDTVPVSYPPPIPRPQAPQARPTSILGSFMGAIAKSVTLPEEDPSIYEQYAAGNQQGLSQSRTAFPRPAGASPASAPMVHLYRTENNTSSQPTSSPTQPTAEPPAKKTSPWLSRMTQPAPVAAPVPPPQAAPKQVQAPAPVSAPAPAAIPSAVVQSRKPTTIAAQAADIGDDEELSLDDGWGDDIDLALDGDDVEAEGPTPKEVSVAPNAPSVPKGTGVYVSKSAQSTTVQETKGYTIEDDIVETRKRWVNPRPGPRQLRPVLSS